MNDTTVKGKEREILLDFIDIYRQNIVLWKIKSKEYSNRILRNKGIFALGRTFFVFHIQSKT